MLKFGRLNKCANFALSPCTNEGLSLVAYAPDWFVSHVSAAPKLSRYAQDAISEHRTDDVVVTNSADSIEI
jgi:hypothetical protein